MRSRDPFDRRALLRMLPLAAAATGAALLKLDRPRAGGAGAISRRWPPAAARAASDPVAGTGPAAASLEPTRDEGGLPRADASRPLSPHELEKIHRFEDDFDDDVWIGPERRPLLVAAAERLQRAERFVGHGHFNLLGFDRYLSFARNHSEIGAVSAGELALLEEIFAADARRYGFFGPKVVERLTETVSEREVVKIAGSGHYLFRGEPRQKFRRIHADLGDSVYVSSGVRSVVKQCRLFLAKAIDTGGNLSRASRSLAPPGYSFHAQGDFDVGKVGLGSRNFSASFAETEEYRKLLDLGYVAIRYTETNPFGVRHEPWHIKIG